MSELSTQAYASAFINADPKEATTLLQQRFRDATALSDELADYFAARRAVEASHARALAKLARRPCFSTRDTAPKGVRPILDALMSELEALTQVYAQRERAIATCEKQVRNTPNMGAWSELPAFEDRLHDTTRDLNLLETGLIKESRKLDSTFDSMQQNAAHRVSQMQKDVDRAQVQWRQDSGPAFQLAQRADVERLTVIKEVVAQFETGAADSANQLARAAEMALQASLSLDVDQEVLSFAQNGGKHRRPAPPPPSHSHSLSSRPLPPSEALAESRGEPTPRREVEEPKSGGLRGAFGRFGRKQSNKEVPSVPARSASPESQASGAAGTGFIRRGKTLLGSKRATKLFSHGSSPGVDPAYGSPSAPEPIQEDERGAPVDLLADDGGGAEGRFEPLQPSHADTAASLGAGALGGALGGAVTSRGNGNYLPSPDVDKRSLSPAAPPAAPPATADDDAALQSLRGTLAPPKPSERRGTMTRRAQRSVSPEARGVVTSNSEVQDPFATEATNTSPSPAAITTLNKDALKISVVEKVNVYFTNGVVSRLMVVGDIEGQVDSSVAPASTEGVTVRLDHLVKLDRLAPNPAFLQATREGQYSLNVDALAREGGKVVLAKYQVHVDPAEEAQYVPVQLQAQWRVLDGHADLLLRYAAEGKLTSHLGEVQLETTVANAEGIQALPEGSFDPETGTAKWTVDPSTLADGGVIRARFMVGEATPQPVKATWSASATLSDVALALVQGAAGTLLPATRSAQAGTYIAA